MPTNSQVFYLPPVTDSRKQRFLFPTCTHLRTSPFSTYHFLPKGIHLPLYGHPQKIFKKIHQSVITVRMNSKSTFIIYFMNFRNVSLITFKISRSKTTVIFKKKIHFELFLKKYVILCDSNLRKQNNNQAIVSL